MFDYEEACPISKATSVLCERWTLQIIREMALGATRFSEFQVIPDFAKFPASHVGGTGYYREKESAREKGI